MSFLVNSSIVIESKDNNPDRFHLHDGDLTDRLSISVSIFSLFSEIYDRFLDPSNSKFEFVTEDDFTSGVNDILGKFSPSTLELLSSFNVENYSFVFEYIRSFLIGGKQPGKEKYIFTAFVTARSKRNFALCLVAASFILLHCTLASILAGQPDAFKEMYIVLLMEIDERILVENACILENKIS